MPTTRRDLIWMTAAGLASLGLPRFASSGETAKKKLNFLVLGGTGFIGPHLVGQALARGHKVTIFNRGKTNTHLFPDVEKLVGDRNNDLKALEGREFDVVFDNHASVPSWVQSSAALLAGHAGLYLYTSSISAYASHAVPGMDVDAELADMDAEEAAAVTSPSEITGGNYGALKAYCEAAARQHFGDKAVIVRPGLIVGPGDPTDRFTYWPARIANGGEVLCPGDPSDPVQFIDARDLAAFYLKIAENRTLGTFNGVGPEKATTIGAMIDGIAKGIGADISKTWANADFLAEHEVQAWMHMPVWVPPAGEYAGFGQVSIAKSLAAGMTTRPLSETARDTLAFWLELPEERRAEPKAGITSAREAEVLKAWHDSLKISANEAAG